LKGKRNFGQTGAVMLITAQNERSVQRLQQPVTARGRKFSEK